LVQSSQERSGPWALSRWRGRAHISDRFRLRLVLPACRERPRRRAADERDELASSHWRPRQPWGSWHRPEDDNTIGAGVGVRDGGGASPPLGRDLDALEMLTRRPYRRARAAAGSLRLPLPVVLPGNGKTARSPPPSSFCWCPRPR